MTREQMHPWHRANLAVADLRGVLGAWRGNGYAAKDVCWHHRGVSGRVSTEVVSVTLTVPEAETLARWIAAQIRTTPR